MVDPTLKGSHEFAEGLDDPFRVEMWGDAGIRGRRFAVPPAVIDQPFRLPPLGTEGWGRIPRPDTR